MNILTKESLYEQLEEIRGADSYPSEQLKDDLIYFFFPKTTSEIVEDLSNVVSAFYGLLIKKAGNLLGNDKINLISEDLFYNLGKLKTEQALQKSNGLLHRDTRAFAVVTISAIYNASPEYAFSVDAYSENYTELTITGVDRYYRICKQLGLTEFLKWPTLLPFMQGIKDTLGLNARVEFELLPFTENNKTNCIYRFTQDANK